MTCSTETGWEVQTSNGTSQCENFYTQIEYVPDNNEAIESHGSQADWNPIITRLKKH